MTYDIALRNAGAQLPGDLEFCNVRLFVVGNVRQNTDFLTRFRFTGTNQKLRATAKKNAM